MTELLELLATVLCAGAGLAAISLLAEVLWDSARFKNFINRGTK